MLDLNIIKGNLRGPQSFKKSSLKVKKSFLGRTVGWFSSKDDSKSVKVAKIALAVFLGTVLASTVIGTVPLVLAIKKWKKGPLSLDRAPPILSLDRAPPIAESLPKCMDQEMIEIFVEKFLHPYITRQITEETEDKNRRPMMDQLLEHLGQVDENQRKEIEEAALKAYFEKAGMGYYVYWATKNPLNKAMVNKALRMSLLPGYPIFEHLKEPLRAAIPKDFPGLVLTDQELNDRLENAIVKVREQRRMAVVGAKKGLLAHRRQERFKTVQKVLKLGASNKKARGAPSLFL